MDLELLGLAGVVCPSLVSLFYLQSAHHLGVSSMPFLGTFYEDLTIPGHPL